MGDYDDLYAGGVAPGSKEYEEQNKGAEERRKQIKQAQNEQQYADLHKESRDIDAMQSKLDNKATDYQNTAYGMQNRTGPTTDYSQANGDYAQSQQARGNQDWVGNKYRDAIEGRGPSVAEKQMNAGRDAAMRDAMQMASGARGGALARSAAQRGAAYQQGSISAQTNQAAGMMRAQEQIAAREGYANITAQQRAQDMQSRQQSAQQSQFLTEAELKQRALNDSAMLGLTNASVATTGQQNASVTGQYDAANQRYLAQYGQQYQKSENDKNRKSTLVGGGIAAGGDILDFLSKSDERAKKDIVPLDTDTPSTSTGSNANSDGSVVAPKITRVNSDTEADKKVEENSKKDAPQDFFKNVFGSVGNAILAAPKQTPDMAMNQYRPITDNSALYSDEKAKKAIDHTNEIQEFLSKLEPFRYQYKNPEKHGEGVRYGVMAQDMEKSKMGDTLVDEDEEGIKQINVPKTFSAILASLAELQKENERLATLVEKKQSKGKSANKKA